MGRNCITAWTSLRGDRRLHLGDPTAGASAVTAGRPWVGGVRGPLLGTPQLQVPSSQMLGPFCVSLLDSQDQVGPLTPGLYCNLLI